MNTEIKFSREYRVWPLSNNAKLNLTNVESHGSTVDEMFENAVISLEDWNGNEGPDWTIGDLSQRDQDGLELEFKLALGLVVEVCRCPYCGAEVPTDPIGECCGEVHGEIKLESKESV